MDPDVPAPSPDADDSAPRGRIGRARLFLKLVVEELRRTTWPSKREVYVMTLAVVLMYIFVGSYIWTLDRVLDYLVARLFRSV